MAEALLTRRVDTLEEVMKALAYQSIQTQKELARLSKEMREFKDEMRAFKAEMHAFKAEMLAFRAESERDRKEMNRQWGDLANRLGTLLEDIVAPNLPRIARELLGCASPDFFAIRVTRRRGGETREYDALVVCPDRVLINETKSKLQKAHVDQILAMIADFPHFYPEYADRRPIGTLATLYPDKSIVRLATRRGVLVMGMGDETMDVLNPQVLATAG